MELPNFVIAGATKSGTTALYRFLRKHSDVFMSENKEPHFLAFANAHPNFRGPGSEEFNRQIVFTPREYEALFTGAERKAAIGEASAMYIYYPQQFLANLRQYLAPSTKVILVLRNPIERAFSSYLNLVRDGLENAPFGRALELESARKEANWMPLFFYEDLGYYDAQLEPFLSSLSEDRLKILLYDDLVRDPAGAFSGICRFLNIKDDISIDLSKKYNESGVPRSVLLHSIYLSLRKTSTLKSLIPESIRRKIVQANLRKPVMEGSARELLSSKYEASVDRLGHMLGRDLRHWLA